MKDFWKKLSDQAFFKKLFCRETWKKLLVWQKPQKITAAIAGGVLVLILALVLSTNFAAGNTVEAIRTCNFTDAAIQYAEMNGVLRWLSAGKIERELNDILPKTDYELAAPQMEELNKLADLSRVEEDSEAMLVLRYWNALKDGDYAAAKTLFEQMDGETAAMQTTSGADALTTYVMSHSYLSREENELVSSAAIQNYSDCEAFLQLLGEKNFDAQLLPQIKLMLKLGDYVKYNPIYALFKENRDTVDEADSRLKTGISFLNEGDAKSAKAYLNSAVTLLQEAEASCAEADSSKAWVEEYSAAIHALSKAVETLRDQVVTDGTYALDDYEAAQTDYQSICSKIVKIIAEVASQLPTQQP